MKLVSEDLLNRTMRVLFNITILGTNIKDTDDNYDLFSKKIAGISTDTNGELMEEMEKVAAEFVKENSYTF